MAISIRLRLMMILGSLSVAFLGCAIVPPATIDGMTPVVHDLKTNRLIAVEVHTSQGKHAMIIDNYQGSEILNASLLAAIERTIRNTQVFKLETPQDTSPYVLSAHILYIDSPTTGTTTTVTIAIDWQLNAPSGEMVFEENVSTQGRATWPSDYIGWPKGNRVATERAVKKNLGEAMLLMSQVDFQ